MPKMHRNTFAGRDPLGELVRSPRPPSRNGGLLIRETEERREGTERERGKVKACSRHKNCTGLDSGSRTRVVTLHCEQPRSNTSTSRPSFTDASDQ